MNLHSNHEFFQDAILATAQHLGIRDVYVEKDYWVTVALYAIFHSNQADQCVFKGGTSLSKCYKLIDRFSEDIDLVVLSKEGENDSQLKAKIRAVSKIVEQAMPEIHVEGLTNKKGNIRKTVHAYNKLREGHFGQVRENVIVEATWLGNFEPFQAMHMGSYIHDMMLAKGQELLIAQYNMAPFTIQVLTKQRTLCEKIMSLVRFSRTAAALDDLRNKIRHVYDIHQMLKDEETLRFYESSQFDEMMVKVGHDDMKSYKNNNHWIAEHPSTAIIFAKPDELWPQIRTAYLGDFKDLVMGELPGEGELVETLKHVGSRLKSLEWIIVE